MNLSLLTVLISLFSIALADDDNSNDSPPSCSADNHCPEKYPCCSSSGTCGTGTMCLGTCDPRFSFNSTSCLPAPICKSGSYKPRSNNMIEDDKYLGNTTNIDFTYYGDVEDKDDSVIIKMPQNKSGGVISSTFYIWYGKVSFKYKTSHNGGVVSAAILFSQVQDEIDYEFVGSELETAQTNYFFEAIADHTHGANLNTTNTYENWHTYEIDWKEDSITWLIDGVALRTLEKKDTLNTTSNVYEFLKLLHVFNFQFGQVVHHLMLLVQLNGQVVQLIGMQVILLILVIYMFLLILLILNVMIHLQILKSKAQMKFHIFMMVRDI